MKEYITEKKINIFGTGGSGKTEFSKKLWNDFKMPMAFDLNGDFKKCRGGIAYDVGKNVKEELRYFVKLYKQLNAKQKIDALFFDDADAYLDYEIMNDDEFQDLVIRHRNKYKVTLVFISKRPQNLPTKIVENSHTQFVFKLDGVNAIKRVNDIDERIGDLLNKVYDVDYSHVLKIEGKPPEWKPAVKI